jgi:hypothetical protein
MEEEDEDERTRTKEGTKEQIAAAGTKKRQNLRDDRTNQWSLTENRHITPPPQNAPLLKFS